MIESLTLENFKSFKRAQAPFGPLTLIVGTNASGKSNIREALRFLHGIGLGYSLADVLGVKYGPGGTEVWRGIRGGATEVAYRGARVFSVAATVRAPEESSHRDQLFTYRIDVDVSDRTFGPRVVRESLHYANGFVFDSHPDADILEQSGDHQIRVRYPRGGQNRKHGRTLAFSSTRPVLSQLSERTSESLDVRKTCSAVLAILTSLRFLDLDVDAMREPSLPGQVILGDRGENLSSVLQAICADAERKVRLVESVRALTPMDCTGFDFLPDLQGRILVYLEESNGFKVSAVSASDGTLRFLALIASLLSEDSGRLYFFEEFDNGIHPTRLHLLLDLVQRACRLDGVQVIGTTHNPALLAALEPAARDDALLVYRSEYAAGSRLVQIVELPDARRVLDEQDLGRLHQGGWLEDAAVFSEPDEEPG